VIQQGLITLQKSATSTFLFTGTCANAYRHHSLGLSFSCQRKNSNWARFL